MVRSSTIRRSPAARRRASERWPDWTIDRDGPASARLATRDRRPQASPRAVRAADRDGRDDDRDIDARARTASGHRASLRAHARRHPRVPTSSPRSTRPPAPHVRDRHAGVRAARPRAAASSGTSGPYPVAFARLTAHGDRRAGRGRGPRRRRRRRSTSRRSPRAGGSRPGGAVIERGFADALGLGVGDTIRLERPAVPRRRDCGQHRPVLLPGHRTPGVIWLTRGQTPTRWRPGQQRTGYVLNLRLTDPASAQAFENGNAATAFGNGTGNQHRVVPVVLAGHPAAATSRSSRSIRRCSLIVSTLLALLAIASIAVVVGSRMAEQTRRVGLLKAVGATPRTGRRRAARREPPARAGGGGGRRDRRPARSRRCSRASATACSAAPRRPPLTRDLGGRRSLIVAIVVAGVRDDRPGDPRRSDEHDPRAQRSRSPAAPPAVADRALSAAAGTAAARRPAGRPSDPALAADRGQHDDRGRPWSSPPSRFEHNVQRDATSSSVAAGIGGATRSADRVTHLVFLLSAILDRPRRDQRDLHHLGDRDRRPAADRAGASALGATPRTDHGRPGHLPARSRRCSPRASGSRSASPSTSSPAATSTRRVRRCCRWLRRDPGHA